MLYITKHSPSQYALLESVLHQMIVLRITIAHPTRTDVQRISYALKENSVQTGVSVLPVRLALLEKAAPVVHNALQAMAVRGELPAQGVIDVLMVTVVPMGKGVLRVITVQGGRGVHRGVIAQVGKRVQVQIMIVTARQAEIVPMDRIARREPNVRKVQGAQKDQVVIGIHHIHLLIH